MRLRVLQTCSFSFVLLIASAVIADDAVRLSWPDKGGPTQDWHVAAEDARGLPISWDEETGKNIAWKVPLSEPGNSTPIIGEDRVWFTSGSTDGKRMYLECFDEETGKVIHHKLLFENEDPEPLGNKVNTYASPSCVLEPDAIYAHFGTYGTARLDPATAEVVWQRRDIKCRHWRGPGSSPVVFENLLILTFDGIDQQFLTALDKRTGKTVWRTDRSTDYDDLNVDGTPRGNGDYRKAFSTPLIIDVDGQKQLISIGARAAFGYDPLTGKEIWTITHQNYNAAATPIIDTDHNRLIINTGSNRAHLVSVRLDRNMRGNIDETHVLWDREKGNSDLSNPILVGDRIFMITTNGIAFCLDSTTGKEIWKSRIGGTFVATPITANGLIYFSNEEGTTTVIRAAETFQEVSSNELKEGMRASPAVAHGAIFLRTFEHLYKITKPKKSSH